MAEGDNIEAYRCTPPTFERVAEWEWAGLLAPFFTGEAQQDYYDLQGLPMPKRRDPGLGWVVSHRGCPEVPDLDLPARHPQQQLDGPTDASR